MSDEVGMETAEMSGDDFKSFVKASFKGLAVGQEDQGKRITNMHQRMDQADEKQDTVMGLLTGTLKNPEDGLVSQVKANSKARKGVWKGVTAIVGALITAAVIAHVTGMLRPGS